MLRNAKTVEGFELRARDGRIGHVRDFFFDDEHWTVRYIVVNTGGWLSGREVLISPVSVSMPEWRSKVLPLNLTIEQIRNSPGIDTAQPVSNEDELLLTQYYNWPAYWGAYADGFGLPIVPPPMLVPPTEAASRRRTDTGSQVADHHLRSMQRIRGYHIEAIDGSIGHADDFIFDDIDWSIRYLVVDTRNWWPGKKVIVAPQWITGVGWDDAKVTIDLTRETIRQSPAYDASEPVTPDYAAQLHDHYGRPRPVR
jgi:hypothetical protein